MEMFKKETGKKLFSKISSTKGGVYAFIEFFDKNYEEKIEKYIFLLKNF